MLEIATADSEATHATTDRCSRKDERKTHDSGVVVMTGVIETVVEARRYLFIKATRFARRTMFAGERTGGDAVCFSSLLFRVSPDNEDVFFRSSEPNLGFILCPPTWHVYPQEYSGNHPSSKPIFRTVFISQPLKCFAQSHVNSRSR
jgi:hypothetical protein